MKRVLYIWEKKNIEFYIDGNPYAFMYQKSSVKETTARNMQVTAASMGLRHASKETYTYEKRPTHMKKDLYI